ncbi:hypothetical protein EG68_11034 [Paragonimus skrjabini miyazakii]|uniref:Uncharacterized protein n=1 Tax=Paragonimus skrjabini miyazakii TaxID=59628 RepID=A0A8S9YMM2_9TREM|nr:hypothetical protein EG68_11034 [Paragonimus skrjabini miyazakii]
MVLINGCFLLNQARIQENVCVSCVNQCDEQQGMLSIPDNCTLDAKNRGEVPRFQLLPKESRLMSLMRCYKTSGNAISFVKCIFGNNLKRYASCTHGCKIMPGPCKNRRTKMSLRMPINLTP